MEAGGERQRTRTVSHFLRDAPGLPVGLDAGVRRMAQVCRRRLGQEDAWAGMVRTGVSDDGT